MTNEELKQTGEALIALSEGKKVQIKSRYGRGADCDSWQDYVCRGEPCPDYSSWYWRIKPEPRKRLIKPEELPPVFWVRDSEKKAWLLVTFVSDEMISGVALAILEPHTYLWSVCAANLPAMPSIRWDSPSLETWEWSPDRKQVNSFWVEEP